VERPVQSEDLDPLVAGISNENLVVEDDYIARAVKRAHVQIGVRRVLVVAEFAECTHHLAIGVDYDDAMVPGVGDID
jgi:hypothetical protein